MVAPGQIQLAILGLTADRCSSAITQYVAAMNEHLLTAERRHTMSALLNQKSAMKNIVETNQGRY